MTDEPDELIDELLSADLDGETTPAEHERIESEPRLLARRAELRTAAELVGQAPDPLAPASVAAVIHRAVAQVDADDSARTATTIKPQRRASRPRLSPLLVAAVVVLLAAIGVGLIVTAPSKRHNVTASRGASSRSEAKSASPHDLAGPPTTTAASGAPNASSSRPRKLDFIGNYPSIGALRAALRTGPLPAARRANVFDGVGVSAGQADRCATVTEARDPRLTRANRRAALTTSVAGKSLLVLEYRARAVRDGHLTTRVVAMGVAACDERLNFER